MDVDVENENYIPNSFEDYMINIFKNTKVSFIVLLIFVILIYVAIFMLVGNNSGTDNNVMGFSKNIVVVILELILWIFLIAIVYVNIVNSDDSDIDFQAKFDNLFNTKIAELSVHVDRNDISNNDNDDTEEDDSESCVNNEDNTNKEVFNIAENKFTYEEAREICNHYGSRLATYDEIENAYNNGASWCNYGWSEDQMAFFPTQKKVYNDLKKIPGHGNDCGRPGINGGYFNNPNIKFGANCYGIKPDAKELDTQYMHAINHSPAVNDEILRNAKNENNEYKNYIVAPFNKEKWSAL